MKVLRQIEKLNRQGLQYMKSKDNIILKKILNYISELKEFIEGYTKEQFVADKKTINASVFNLSQIGELAGKISEETMKDNPRNRMERIKRTQKQNCTRL